ncbi:MAG: hypothetical protein J1F09_08050 [Oscillospiraceae bacterium]|nr:hypothetical protein [Oscillospiraceae bacterium]
MPNKPKVDLTGKKYNRLTVIKYCGGGKWECLCECGRTVNVSTNALSSGNTQSCGCLNQDNIHRKRRNSEDITGRVYGNIEAIRYIKSGRNGTEWECRCGLCGKLFVIPAAYLKQYKSCGCLGVENKRRNVAKLHDKIKETKTNPSIMREEANANNKTTGIRGVCYLEKTGVYIAYISYQGKQRILKRSKDIEECIKARKEAEAKVRARD